MGRIGVVKRVQAGTVGADKVLSISVDLGGGDVVSAQLFDSSGNDCPPRIGDFAACMPGPGTGEWFVVATSNPALASEADPGERRTVARGATGNAVSTVTQGADGSIKLENAMGSIEIKSTGVVDINNGNFTVKP